MTHTPGPWTVKMWQDWPFQIGIEPRIVSMSRYAYGTKDNSLEDVRAANSFPEDREAIAAAVAEQEANARLIAAAPDLLALVELVYGSFGGGRTVSFSDIDVAEFAAAIAKARGRE